MCTGRTRQLTAYNIAWHKQTEASSSYQRVDSTTRDGSLSLSLSMV